MAGRSLNKVQLIGNLTRDPELRYTPNGKPVCGFGVATNNSWVTDTGERKDEPEFHNIVVWGKLGETCSQYLKKGNKVYVEGRLQTRNWEGKDGQQKTRTEVVANDMIMLGGPAGRRDDDAAESEPKSPSRAKKAAEPVDEGPSEDISPEDIPF